MMRKLLAIVGPTASGKTDISLELARRFDLEIVSVDSRQIYRYMDIGTAKPTKLQREIVRHHMVDIVDPDQNYSAGRYGQEARSAVRQIESLGKLPLLVGGSGLYLRALVDGIFSFNSRDLKFRDLLRSQSRVIGVDGLHQRLSEVDPETASKVHPKDFQRISRALEVHHLTGKPISDLQKTLKDSGLKGYILLIGLKVERGELYRRVDERVDLMISMGLVDEVEGIMKMGYDSGLKSLQTFGYSEIMDYLHGGSSLSEAIDRIKLRTRRYAKRQMTWFRKDKRIKWVTSNDELFTILDAFRD